jgi:hypothetical protein
MITCGQPGLLPVGAGAWACQARFVYEEDGLDAVAESELARMRFRWVLTVDSSTNRLAAISAYPPTASACGTIGYVRSVVVTLGALPERED